MGDQTLLKVMAFSVAVAIVVSCLAPCIASDELRLGESEFNHQAEYSLKEATTENKCGAMPYSTIFSHVSRIPIGNKKVNILSDSPYTSCGDIIPTIGTSLKSSRRDEYSNI
jgi:hypothetical protein